jgi:shikimate kinase
MSIPGVFDVLGASTFRKTETELLLGTGSRSNVVISLGGGSVVSDENLRFCLENGFLVYLKASDSFLADRLSGSLRNRPMLFGDDGTMLDGEALRTRVAALLSERASSYERAHMTVDVDDLSLGTIAKQICTAIKTEGAG